MAVEKSPAFSFYARDWLSDAKVRTMTDEARGVYMDLLCYCWLEGTLPPVDGMARLTHRTPEAFGALWPQLQPCFTLTDEGWRQKRLDVERDTQAAHRARMSAHGKKGARGRWKKPAQNARALPGHNPGTSSAMANDDSSSSSSSSSSVQTALKSAVCVQRPARAQGVIESVGEPDGRAERLWERWRALLLETRTMRLPLTPRASDLPKLIEAVELVPDEADLLQRLDRFMRLTADQQKTLNVKAITPGYFVMALPQLVETPDANDAAGQQWLKAHEHDTH